MDQIKSVIKSAAIVGSGPAGLMAADVISKAGFQVTLFEKRKGAGRKLLIAGSSGLNITNSLPISEFVQNYSAPNPSKLMEAKLIREPIQDFSPQDWIQFIEDFQIETFEGTSGRFFVKEMKASKLLRAWINRLTSRKVDFQFEHECIGFSRDPRSDKWTLHFAEKESSSFDAVCFCLGGGSYEPNEVPLRWPSFFKDKGIEFDEFTPSNTGYQLNWSEAFLKEAEGMPLKNIKLTSSRGTRAGEVIITNYGMEGTPVYFVGEVGEVYLDLKPDLSVEQIIKKCSAVKENLSPIRRIKRQLNLSPASLALLFHYTGKTLSDLTLLARQIKHFPLSFMKPQPLSESISAAGGLRLTELDEQMMLRKFPGVFAAGEMLNWDAPTGGFLIQACVSQGYRMGNACVSYLRH